MLRRWPTSNSSAYRPAGPHDARARSKTRTACSRRPRRRQARLSQCCTGGTLLLPTPGGDCRVGSGTRSRRRRVCPARRPASRWTGDPQGPLARPRRAARRRRRRRRRRAATVRWGASPGGRCRRRWCRRARSTRRRRAVGVEPSHALQPLSGGQPAVRPVARFELPNAGVGFLPPGFDGVGSHGDGRPAVGVQPFLGPCGRQQKEDLPERVELELVVDMVPHQVGTTGVAGELQAPLVGHGTADVRVRRAEPRAVSKDTSYDEPPRPCPASGSLRCRPRLAPSSNCRGSTRTGSHNYGPLGRARAARWSPPPRARRWASTDRSRRQWRVRHHGPPDHRSAAAPPPAMPARSPTSRTPRQELRPRSNHRPVRARDRSGRPPGSPGWRRVGCRRGRHSPPTPREHRSTGP